MLKSLSTCATTFAQPPHQLDALQWRKVELTEIKHLGEGHTFGKWEQEFDPHLCLMLKPCSKRISQPQHCHFGPNNTLWWGAVLYTVEYVAASPVSTHQLPVAPPTQLWQPNMSLDIAKWPREIKLPPIKNHCSELVLLKNVDLARVPRLQS